MRFVTPKTESQQTLSALHRVRESLTRNRTMTINQIHGFLFEFGQLADRSNRHRAPAGRACSTLPAPRLVSILERLHVHSKYFSKQIVEIDKDIKMQLADDDLGQRLLSIPSVGPITASVLASEIRRIERVASDSLSALRRRASLVRDCVRRAYPRLRDE
jgi:transposase